MPVSPLFPTDLSDDPSWGPPGELPPRLPYPPHHPPLLRRAAAAAAAEAAAEAAAAAISSPSSSSSASASAAPPNSHASSTPHHPSGSRRPLLLLRHRSRNHPTHFFESAFMPPGTQRAHYASQRGMPVLFEERVDWETPYDPSTHAGASARRRLPTRRRRVNLLTDFLAWRTRRTIDGEDLDNDSLGYSYEELLQLDDGNVKCGLSNDELANLPETQASKEHMNSECHICLESFDFGAQIVPLKCQHTFHKGCIHTWLKIKRSCPICRTEL